MRRGRKLARPLSDRERVVWRPSFHASIKCFPAQRDNRQPLPRHRLFAHAQRLSAIVSDNTSENIIITVQLVPPSVHRTPSPCLPGLLRCSSLHFLFLRARLHPALYCLLTADVIVHHRQHPSQPARVPHIRHIPARVAAAVLPVESSET
jgi:hypothetical protein